jgi:hypothetical protein
MKKKNLKILSDMEGLMMGSDYGIQFPVSKKQDEYITIREIQSA